eukprot:Nitzschia sp. Nitz4//scaffold31_size150131//8137//9957//NITZ4_002809-RA/size150131-processed-gene-0.181-mRNA-1//1//CDS//3329547602//8030//frame0
MLWWAPPKQRQRWKDTQILPSASWGQIFFDLFYVGGCINLGNLLKDGMSSGQSGAPSAVLYFLGVGFPIMMMWFDKLWFDARFTTRPHHDFFHRVLDALQIGFVATAMCRIRTVDELSNPCEHSDMFLFSLSLFLNSVATLVKYAEVYYFGIGDPSAKVAARRDVTCRLLPTLLFWAATVDSAYSFWGIARNEESSENTNNRPVIYCLLSWVSWAAVLYMDIVACAPKRKLVDISVPMNIHFCIHRYGEWFMLMFGESVISLLIVDSQNESAEYYMTFYSGILSVIFLAHLHYSGQPHNADHHALGRSRHGSYIYTILVPIHSVALIAMGVSYKLFLYEFTSKYHSKAYRKTRSLGGDYDEAYDEEYDDHSDSEERYYDAQVSRRQSISHLFCASIVIVLICMDVEQILHRGLPKLRWMARRMTPWSLTTMVLLKYMVWVALATMSIYNHDPHVIPVCGLVAILCQDILRNSFHHDTLGTSSNQGTRTTLKEQQQQEWDGKDFHDDHTHSTTSGSTMSGTFSHWSAALGIDGIGGGTDDRSHTLALFERVSLSLGDPTSRTADRMEYDHDHATMRSEESMTSTGAPTEGSGSGSDNGADYTRMAEI